MHTQSHILLNWQIQKLLNFHFLHLHIEYTLQSNLFGILFMCISMCIIKCMLSFSCASLSKWGWRLTVCTVKFFFLSFSSFRPYIAGFRVRYNYTCNTFSRNSVVQTARGRINIALIKQFLADKTRALSHTHKQASTQYPTEIIL